MYTIEVNEWTYRAIELASRLTSLEPGAVVERLVQQMSEAPAKPASAGSPPNGVTIYADYNGQRTKGVFDPVTTRIDIIEGKIAGTSHKTPSAAARAVVEGERPGVNSNRNGWSFWYLDDGSGKFLQSIRHS